MSLRHWPAAWLLVGAALAIAVAFGPVPGATAPAAVQFVFTSDAHYGLTRATFRGHHDVDATEVNRALVAAINSLPDARFPSDGGLRAGERVVSLDFVVEGGDVANREERLAPRSIQPASRSWEQFAHDYIDGLRTSDPTGAHTPLFIVPGNHEASNVVGFYRAMEPASDPGAIVSIYNLMRGPRAPIRADDYEYGRDRLFVTREVGGVHLQFLQIWPDSAMRARMNDDLARVEGRMPVLVFTHDQPDAEGKHFINPNGAHDINASDQFENLLADRFADGPSPEAPSLIEQAQFESFLASHPQIDAYFHGNSNWQQAYEWNGPKRTARLHAFRVDSPMKGAISSRDETKLSFQVIAVDAARRVMTVRECLWNGRGRETAGITWGDSVTLTLR